jgi:hypothetical protein
MAAVSYSLVIGGRLEDVVAATSAPGAGQVEIRMDQTATTVTDPANPQVVNTITRAPRKMEIIQALENMIQYLVRDTNVLE